MQGKEYRIFMWNGVRFVLTHSRERGDQADFMHTGMALAGVLHGGESLQDFAGRQFDLFVSNYAKNEQLKCVNATTEWRRNVKTSKDAKAA